MNELPLIPGIIAILTEANKIIPHLEDAIRERNLAHALELAAQAAELAECRRALQAASELLQREKTRIEYLTTTITQLMDVINESK